MSSLDFFEGYKIIERRNQIADSAATAISRLNRAVLEAIEYSIFMEENLENDFPADKGVKEKIRQDFLDTLASLNEILPTIEILRQKSQEEITVEQLRSLTGKTDFDVTEYRKQITRR